MHDLIAGIVERKRALQEGEMTCRNFKDAFAPSM